MSQVMSLQGVGRLEIKSPRIVTSGWVDAHQVALEELEPVFVPLQFFADDRGWSLMNMLTGVMGPQGQMNYSMQYPDVVKAWHRHDHQTDFWTCVQGNIKAGIYREADGAAWMVVIGEKRPGVLVIPPPLWHGAAVVGAAPAGLLYYVTRGYNPKNPDEYRRPWDSIDGFPWDARNG
jgi:dTDP-4-dehydrorhamnose 3,5-epimerase